MSTPFNINRFEMNSGCRSPDGTWVRYSDIEPVLKSAQALSDFLDANVGETADWALELATDDDNVAEELCKLLNGLSAALGKNPREAFRTL